MSPLNNNSSLVLGVSDFVAVFNQTLELAYPSVNIVGELANFRISKNRWVYFDLKDELASVKCFGTVYQLPGPLEDGMLLQVTGQPRLHAQYGFSITISNLRPVGEGSLKRAAELLEAKLRAEGLFELNRKRTLPYPPKTIGLITSGQSAAYADFIKIVNERWAGVHILLADVQVQGEAAAGQITAAIRYFNQVSLLADLLVITRGGGSAEDLAAFNTEQVTRAIAASRIPTLVAIGHEVDVSLAELAADQRASTPSNAAQLLVPDKRHELVRLHSIRQSLMHSIINFFKVGQDQLKNQNDRLNQFITQFMQSREESLRTKSSLLKALSPNAIISRGYVVVRSSKGKVIKSIKKVKAKDNVALQWQDGQASATISSISK